MSKLVILRAGVVSAGLGFLISGLALAQQDQGGQSSAGQGRGSETSQSSGQSDRSSGAQSGRAASQGTDQASQAAGTSGAGSRSATGGQGREVEQYLTACLLADNQAEVQLSQFAQQHASNSDVKEFAQMMVQDHQKMIQQLQQLSGAGSSAHSGQSAAGATESGRSGSSTSGSSTQSLGTSSAGTSGTAGATSGASETSGAAGQSGASAAGASTNGNTASSDSSGGGTSLNSLGAGGATAAQAAQGGGAVQQIAMIDQQIVQRKSQAILQELQQKKGAEFDKGFVGTAINAHIHALAALEVTAQQGQGQLTQVAQQARPVVQQHLEHAKQLMKKLEGESGSSATASRSTGSQTER